MDGRENAVRKGTVTVPARHVSEVAAEMLAGLFARMLRRACCDCAVSCTHTTVPNDYGYVEILRVKSFTLRKMYGVRE